MILNNDKEPMIWVQRLDSAAPAPLPGTEGAEIVFWSPDGKNIGFWADGKMKKISADGGTPLPICDLPAPWSATWNTAGVILASTPRLKSWIVTVSSGAVKEWKAVFWPRFLPDGKHVVYVNEDRKLGGFRGYVEDYLSGRITELMPTHTHVLFAPDPEGGAEGYLLFSRAGTLLAQRFDAGRLVLSGEPAPVAQQVGFFRPTGGSTFDASADGILVYTRLRWIWYQRNDAALARLLLIRLYRAIDLQFRSTNRRHD